MAVPKGILQFSGTLDGFSVYHHKRFGWIMRRKGGPDPKKIKTQARFERVRENGREFGACAKAAGLVRRGLYKQLKESGDGFLNSLLTKVFLQIKQLDTESKRGERKISKGLKTKEGRMLLESFDLNPLSPLGRLLSAPYRTDTAKQQIHIPEMVPKKHLKAKKGATHVRFKSVLLGFDPEDKETETTESTAEKLALDSKTQSLVLTAPKLTKQWEVQLLLLQICFYQEVSGKHYQLPDKERNSMKVMAVYI